MAPRPCIALVLVLPALTLAVACGGSSPSSTSAPTPPEVPAEAVASLPVLDEFSGAARSGAVVDILHGREVADPYRLLEADNDMTHAWIDGRTAEAEAYLALHADPARAARLGELLTIGFFGEVHSGGNRVFFTKRDGDAEQAALFVASPGEPPRRLVDPNTLGDRVALDWVAPSPSGRYVAYGLSRDGDERSTLYLLDVDADAALGEAIPHTKWTAVAWLNDDSGFYYTRYPSPGEPDYDAEAEDNYFRHLFFHTLGADSADDPLVYRAQRTEFVGAAVSDDDRWVAITVFHSWSESDLYLLDRQGASGEAVPLVVGESFLVYGTVHEGRLLAVSNEDHPRGRLLATPADAPGPRADWSVLVDEGPGTIESFQVAGERLVVQYVQDIAARVAVFGLDGAAQGDLALPTRGSIGSLALAHDGSQIAFTFDSFFHPPTLFLATDVAAEPVVLDQVTTDVDTTAYELEQLEVPSRDGTPVNVFLVHRRGLERDGQQPVLLNGYGGFNISMMPGFARNTLYWLERGGVYAVANIRGGGEHGEDWHRAGMLHNKPNTFDDFEAVIRWLSESGLSSPERIALIGASNGGLLMGAMLTRCPDAFRAAIASVGLYDMVRFTQFPPAEIWMGEYGDPENADDFEVLVRYSPYHNVVDGTAYPAAFIDTAEQDTRVSWRHSVKFAARLQEANASDRPILFYMSRGQGHGAGTGVSALVQQYVRYYTFIETELGVAP